LSADFSYNPSEASIDDPLVWTTLGQAETARFLASPSTKHEVTDGS
jgi:hypothetical protein